MPDIEEFASIKLSIIKDLEKTLKIGYEHQYRNILSKIVSNKKRFIKKRLPGNVSESTSRYDALSAELTNYLANLFDVFGESAVLNAKKTFEENGFKWGRKLRRKIVAGTDNIDLDFMIKNLYINVPGVDSIEISDGGLVWHFSKQGSNSVNGAFGKFHARFYDIKASWLHSFIKSLTSQYTSIFEKKCENEAEIITSIELKENMV